MTPKKRTTFSYKRGDKRQKPRTRNTITWHPQKEDLGVRRGGGRRKKRVKAWFLFWTGG